MAYRFGRIQTDSLEIPMVCIPIIYITSDVILNCIDHEECRIFNENDGIYDNLCILETDATGFNFVDDGGDSRSDNDLPVITGKFCKNPSISNSIYTSIVGK